MISPTPTSATATGIFSEKLSRMAAVAKAALKAIQFKTTGGTNPTDPAWSDNEEAMKRFWPGSVVKLTDGSGGVERFAVVPMPETGKPVVKKHASGLQLRISMSGDDKVTEYWGSAKVKSDIVAVWPGVLVPAASVMIGGLEATLVAETSPGGFCKVIVKVDGDDDGQLRTVAEAATAAGHPVNVWRSIGGAAGTPPVRSVAAGTCTIGAAITSTLGTSSELTGGVGSFIESLAVLSVIGLGSSVATAAPPAASFTSARTPRRWTGRPG